MSVQHVFDAQSLEAAQQAAQQKQTLRPRLLIAGGAGTLGSAVLEQCSGAGRWREVFVLTQDALQSAVLSVTPLAFDAPVEKPIAEAGVIVLDHARNAKDRERAFWMPKPEALLDAAKKMKQCGVTSLAVVVPHLQATLPHALKAGLANLDEQAVNALGFEHLLFVRPSRASNAEREAAFLPAVAQWMLSQLQYTIPQSQRPVRGVKLASFVDAALSAWHAQASSGTKVVSTEVLWQAALSRDVESFAQQWLAS